MGDEFYQLDKRLGSVCTINGKSAYGLFNADLKELIPVAGSIAADFSKALGGSGLHVASYKINTGGIKAIFYVGGAAKEDCYLNTSNLIAECQECIIKTDEDRFEYVAVLTAFDVVETGIEFYNEVTLTFSAVKRLPMVTRRFDKGNGSFKNIGSIPSGMRVAITPGSALASLTVNGIVITDMTAGLPFVIDGLVGEVMCNGINRFLNTDLIEFPKANPGDNEIKVSDTNVVVEVSFYPTFIV